MVNQSVQRASAFGPHLTLPSEEWLRAFLDHVKQTGRPEDFPGIERNPPPDWSRPYIVHRFDVDRKKRPNRDMAPCAMCSPYSPKCLEDLCVVHYEDEGVIRIIGPDCGSGLAGGDLLKAARKAFDRRQRQQRAEEFLEKNLTKVGAWIEALSQFRPVLVEAERLHRKLRHDNSAIGKKFRQVRNQSAGILSIDIVIEKEKSEKGDADDRPERIGPRGFGRGADAVDSYTERFGVLEGAAIFASTFEPVADLDTLIVWTSDLPRTKTVEDTFDWLCEHESLELFEQIVERMRRINARFTGLVEQVDSVVAFFNSRNIEGINRWGTHPKAEFRIEAGLEGGVLTLKHGGRLARLRPDLEVLSQRVAWAALEV